MPTDHTIELEPKPQPASATRQVTTLAVTGMTCGNCARHVTEAIQGVTGVQSAAVSLDSHEATVYWHTAPNVEAVIQAVEQEGYSARVQAAHTHEPSRSLLAGWQLNLWLGLPVLVFLAIGEWGLGLDRVRWFQWLSFGLAAVVQVLAGARFYLGAWSQLKVRSSNMDTLVALGSTTAFVYSVWALFSGQGGHLYFMEAVAIISLISAGHWLESLVSVRASGALRQLLNLAPAVARRRLPDGTEAEVPVTELRVGNSVALRPGDRVPTDGEVVEGDSAVDESMLTGESTPSDKSPRSLLYAGTHNLNGRLVMRVTATGQETALAHIIAAVQRAQTSRANIQRLGDKVSSVFVPLVVSVALAAALWWGLAPQSAAAVHAWLGQYLWPAHPPEGALAAAFIIGAAVLIVACPCAMGLATPAAIMAGSNAAAQRGILIRDGIALEKAGHVTAVLFDKTGTLTLGKPQVAEVWEANPAAKALAAGLAQHSSHPISQALAGLSASPAEFTGWEEVRGSGVQGQSQVSSLESQVSEGRARCPQRAAMIPQAPSLAASVGEPRRAEDSAPDPLEPERSGPVALDPSRRARLGSLRWLKDAGVDLGPGEPFIQRWTAEGATLIGLAVGTALYGLFALKDTLKPGAREIVGQLHRQGLATYLVTGDNALTAASIARQVGVPPENVFTEVRPEQKAALVKQLQEQGRRIAFVGDGINDAPALEQADLGIAVSRASDIAREAADIILLKSEIEAVPESLGLARATLRTIKQNLFWAFFYNALGVPLAALGFMSPILCAAAMGISDLVVIGNALRLRRWRL